MPRNANHRAHRYSHLAASTTIPYGAARLRHIHPDWPICTAGCGWPVDPAVQDTVHPTCAPDTDRTGDRS